jgi:FlaA1/EpsC-like NDP-sugar epimerase
MVPSADELRNGAKYVHIRDIDINDLLRRDPVRLDRAAIREMTGGRRVMVTGAGGSIGSEICRQILKSRPELLLLVERAENSLFQIDRELARFPGGSAVLPRIADICDEDRVATLFEQYRPQLVFHAAAHKHVPMMECNPGEAIANNVFGTKILADVADRFSAERLVMISTDKAVNPTSVMGVSKQLAEQYIHALSEASGTTFVVVRFGNVLGSTGSVVPVFQEQIRRGGPITITHPKMQRYFMTIPEATELVLQAAAMGRGGEIFVLDMGEPVKIVDLAHEMICLSGLSTEDIDIVYTGPRPGEKLYEELYLDEEETLPTAHPQLRVAYHRFCCLSEVCESIDQLRPVIHQSDDIIRQRLADLMPEYACPVVHQREEVTMSVTDGDGNGETSDG